MTSAGAGSAARSTKMRSRVRTWLILATGMRGGKVTKVLELGKSSQFPDLSAQWESDGPGLFLRTEN
jgi:hypothetical protein